MVVQAVLDSLSRCFGAPVHVNPTRSPGGDNYQMTYREDGTTQEIQGKSNNRYVENVEALDSHRRQGRPLGIELNDEEYDNLFIDVSNRRGDNMENRNNGSSNSRRKRAPDMEVEYADVSAKLNEAAKPSRHASPRKIDRKNDIFRSRVVPPQSFASRLLGRESVARALCFANPVHDCATGGQGIAKNDTYGANTVNTAEDTLTSTVCFDAKHSHLVEVRPPMPLFNRYKVECNSHDDNALIGIVNSGSHHSVHMLKEFQDHANSRSHLTSDTHQIQGSAENSQVTPKHTHVEATIQSAKPTSNVNKTKHSTSSQFKKHMTKDQPPEMQELSDNSMSTSASLSSVNKGGTQVYAA